MSTPEPGTEVALPGGGSPPAPRAFRDPRRMPLSARFGIAVIIGYVLIAIAAPVLAPYGQTQVFPEAYSTWSREFLLGTDHLGRDMLSRLIYGIRNTLWIAIATTALSFMVGSLLGMAAALNRSWLDQVLSRLVDVLMAIPGLILALMLLSIFGSSVLSLILIIALIDATRVFRLARAVSMNVVVSEYVEAASLRGDRLSYIMLREILPNIMPPLAAEFGLRFCFVFLTIASLSFLGVGIQPPSADLGSMVRETAKLITFAEMDLKLAMTPLLPAAVIALITMAVNFLVDWLLYRSSGLRDGH